MEITLQKNEFKKKKSSNCKDSCNINKSFDQINDHHHAIQQGIKNMKKENVTMDRNSVKQSDLLEDEDYNISLKINDKFSKDYQKRKLKEELRLKNIRMEDIDEYDSYSSSTDDENAEMLTDKVEHKIFDALNRIKNNDEAIYIKDKKFFSDSDFDIENSNQNEKKPLTETKYADFVRDTLIKEGSDVFVVEEEKFDNSVKSQDYDLKTYSNTQKDLKNAFLKAAESLVENEDDFLVVEQKNRDKLSENEHDLLNFVPAKNGTHDDSEIMRHYWAPDENLDSDERFLRDYILNKMWMDDNKLGNLVNGNEIEKLDEEDEKHLEEAENFEAQYNFRFEEEDGSQIASYPRTVEGSLRQLDSKRKEKRKERNLRKIQEKDQQKKLLELMKEEKKNEILERIKKIQAVSGCTEAGILKIDLDADFDPEKFDNEMQTLFDDDYYKQTDQLKRPDLAPIPEEFEDILDTEKLIGESKSMNRLKLKKLLKKKGKMAKKLMKQRLGNDDEAYPPIDIDTEYNVDTQDTNGSSNNEFADYNLDDSNIVWWQCDYCGKGIPELKKRFDCTVCENYTLCQKCYRQKLHNHSMISKRIPLGSQPPKLSREITPKMKLTLDKYLDEYYQLDYEDIIGGDLPTRFKYRSVSPDSYGLTTKYILKTNDKELQNVVPITKVVSYAKIPKKLLRKKVKSFLLGKKKQNLKEKNETDISKKKKTKKPDQRQFTKSSYKSPLPSSKNPDKSINGEKLKKKGCLSSSRLSAYNLDPIRFSRI